MPQRCVTVCSYPYQDSPSRAGRHGMIIARGAHAPLSAPRRDDVRIDPVGGFIRRPHIPGEREVAIGLVLVAEPLRAAVDPERIVGDDDDTVLTALHDHRVSASAELRLMGHDGRRMSLRHESCYVGMPLHVRILAHDIPFKMQGVRAGVPPARATASTRTTALRTNSMNFSMIVSFIALNPLSVIAFVSHRLEHLR